MKRTLVVTFVVLTLFGVGVTSRYALLTAVLDGLAAMIVVLPAILVGTWLVPLFRLESMPLRWHFLLSAALGLGAVSVLVLLLGIAGFLQRPVWITLLAMFAIAGLVRARTLLAGVDVKEGASRTAADRSWSGAWSYLLLLACPFLVLAIIAAAHAPGFIWEEEAWAYDVLEYHLQLPKEYVEAGHITYLPHNVYANFPANVEMLYLLAMIVLDDVHDIGTTANMIHLVFGVLAVFAAWVAGREWSPRAGIVCAVVMATAGWLAYLCGLAYVENGMLFFGTVATAVLIRAIRLCTFDADADPADAKANGKAEHLGWIVLAGALAGLACGCKYTALPMIAVPLGVGVVLIPGASIQRRIGNGCVFGIAALLAFSPWLIKNQTMTGNPVFPLANTVFHAAPPGWGVEETAQWNRGHVTQGDEQSLGARLGVLWHRILWDRHQRFGPVIFIIAIAGFFARRRDRVDLVLLIVLIVQLAVWMFMTHIFARFAIVLLIPLVLLCGRAVLSVDGVTRRRILLAVLVAGCAWNFAFAARLQRRECTGGASASLMYEGRIPGYEYLGIINRDLPRDAKILLIGEARAFYFNRNVDYCVTFNRNPFFEAVLQTNMTDGPLSWLREHDYTHVLVNWSEVRRLAPTYGFSPAVSYDEIQERFNGMSVAGLILLRVFPHPETNTRYVELYEVPH